eukprot:3107473-Heterocapsa_arctica.AAC.1
MLAELPYARQGVRCADLPPAAVEAVAPPEHRLAGHCSRGRRRRRRRQRRQRRRRRRREGGGVRSSTEAAGCELDEAR